MANSLYSFNYFPLVSGSTTNLVFKKNTPSAWQISVIRSIRVQKEYIIRMANSCYSRYYIPLISGSTTIGASLIVFVSLLV